jgi:hypothetical protein
LRRGSSAALDDYEHQFDTLRVAKRYREPVEVELEAEAPAGFCWRGRTYRVHAVLGHWREDAGYWSGGGMEIPQRDLWRVEAARGVYELVCEQGAWRLDRVWD